MSREEFFEHMKKYFVLSQAESEKFLRENFKSEAYRARLKAILDVVLPCCEKFVDKSDEKLKRKVGHVLLSKLDYSQFFDKESTYEMKERLNELFYQITAKGINPYKVLYCSVLTDGNLKRDNESGSKYLDSSRDFLNIYDSLQETLKLPDQEAIEIFERCSTLIAKGYAYKFPQIFNTLLKLTVYDNQTAYYLFKQSEVIDILKINPSLFVISSEKIKDSFNYLQRKMLPTLEQDVKKEMEENPNMNLLAYRTIMTRKWLKNNSSLLTINPEIMLQKEKHFSSLNRQTDNLYEKQLASYFQSPIGLSNINQIPYEKINKFAYRNIKLLESFVSTEKTAKYLAANQLFIGMDSSKVGILLGEIEELDKENPQEKYFEKFLEFGKTLFASNLDFSVPSIVEKLKNNYVVRDVDVDSMSGQDCLHEFVEIFFEGKHDLTVQIEDMIKAKKDRNQRGETALRNDIRVVGKKVSELPRILKSDWKNKSQKREEVLNIASNIASLHQRRFALLGQVGVGNTNLKTSEEENSKKIETVLNLLRDTFEQKRFKIGKKFSNTDQLFERTMDYLSTCFDDKEAISDLFKAEIVDNFNEAIISTFETKLAPQQQLFGTTYKVEGVDSELKKPLGKVGAEINKVDFFEGSKFFEF